MGRWFISILKHLLDNDRKFVVGIVCGILSETERLQGIRLVDCLILWQLFKSELRFETIPEKMDDLINNFENLKESIM